MYGTKVSLYECVLPSSHANIFTFDRYRRKVSLYNERVEDLNMVTQQRDDIKKQYDEWRKKRYGSLLFLYTSIPANLYVCVAVPKAVNSK